MPKRTNKPPGRTKAKTLNPLQKSALKHLVAYEYSPPESRLTHKEFCDLIGIHTDTLLKWRGDPVFKASLEQAFVEAEAASDPFALCMRQWSLEQLYVLYSKAKTTSDKRQLLRQIEEATAHVVDPGELIDVRDMTEDDLLAICMNEDISVLGMSIEEMKRQLGGNGDGERDSDTADVPGGGIDDALGSGDGDMAGEKDAAGDRPAAKTVSSKAR